MKSALWPALKAILWRAWRLRWLPIILGATAVGCAITAFVAFDRRVTHIVQPAAAADAADHPWRYAEAAQAAADAAYRAGVVTVAFGLLTVVLLAATILAARDVGEA